MRKISEGAVSSVPGEPELPGGTSGPPRQGGAEAKRDLDEESRAFKGLLDGRSGDGKDEAPGGKPFAGTGGGPPATVPRDPERPAEGPEAPGGAAPLPGGTAVPERRGGSPGSAGAPAESAGKGERTGVPGSGMPGPEKDAPQAPGDPEGASPGTLRGDGTGRPPAPSPRETAGRESTPGPGLPPCGENGKDGGPGAARPPEARGVREGPKGDETGKGDAFSGNNGVSPPEGWAEVPMTTGEAILRFFEGTVPGRPAGETAGPRRTAETLAAAAREIADWVLVSGRFGEGKEEVRIFLKERVLAGTEVRISREGGDIRLEIRTDSADSRAFLAGRTDDLARTLKDRVGENVTIDLRFSGSGREEGNGRSRQRRNLYDETDR
ncbi:MAG TPA: type III secretion HpaP family protein [Syntrophales bacterium]|nr:type III secretion HpaP family protein [Syntrophales bacterium]HQN77715.1 type III secretion HpaP family protein [Syntrophales bacterium]HQQ27097.1 type III secretion HpaP family protein [Syntrophales bacterium]